MTSLSILCYQLLRIKAAPAVDLSTRVNKEGQAISYTSDYKHPATPETRIVDEFGKKVKNKDPATKKQRGYCSGKYPSNAKQEVFLAQDFQKKRSRASIFPKAQAEIATMCA